MKNNWAQILVFSMLSVILGFILGRVTVHEHGKEKHIMMKQMTQGNEPMVWQGEDGEVNEFILKGEGDDEVQMTIDEIAASSFEGDTLIQKGGALIHVIKREGEIEVNVEAGSKQRGTQAQAREEKHLRLRIEKEDPS